MTNTQIATEALEILKNGIDISGKRTIMKAYDMIEDESFSWDDVPESIFNEWDKLVDKANDILFS